MINLVGYTRIWRYIKYRNNLAKKIYTDKLSGTFRIVSGVSHSIIITPWTYRFCIRGVCMWLNVHFLASRSTSSNPREEVFVIQQHEREKYCKGKSAEKHNNTSFAFKRMLSIHEKDTKKWMTVENVVTIVGEIGAIWSGISNIHNAIINSYQQSKVVKY